MVPELTEGIDLFVMLLSSNWFFEYWDSIGLFVDQPAKFQLQQRCQKIVKQIMSSAHTNCQQSYYLTSFSKARIAETAKLFTEALVDAGCSCPHLFLPDDATATVKLLALLGQITDGLLAGNFNDGFPLLPVVLRKSIESSNYATSFEDFDFEDLCVSSDTPWDLYLRSLSPELPTAVSDYLHLLIGQVEFIRLWNYLLKNHTKEELQTIQNWYSQMVEILTGEKVNWELCGLQKFQ